MLLSVSGAAGDHWADLVPQLSGTCTCITYGRPGLGGSDPLPRDARMPQGLLPAAEELRQVLHAISSPPWVLVTASVGAFVADRFITAFPEDVAAVVFTDPTGASPWPASVVREPSLTDSDEGYAWSWGECYAELALPLPSPPPPAVVVSSSIGRWVRRPPSTVWWEPLTLEDVDKLWQQLQADWATRYGASRIVADTAGHFVHQDQPDLVAGVVKIALAATRAKQRPRLDAAAVRSIGGTLQPPLTTTDLA